MEAMLILAGGTGTRLWPASTPERPKQFLTLGLPRSFLQTTVERSLAVNSKAEIVIVTGKSYQEGVEEEVRAYVQEGARITVLEEPRGRNTAPAILLGALYLRNRLSPSSRVLILSADHLIEPLEAFVQDVRNAAELSARGWVTVFGVPPSSPHTGYGYLERGEAEGKGFRVKAFKEKPDEQTARSYLATGRYYWNSGMFLFTLEMLFSQYEQYATEVVNSFRDARLMEPWSQEEIPVEEIQCAYERVPSISVDYAVLERSNRVAMIPASFSWNDVGSWDEVARLLPNEAPNIVELEGSNNAVYSDIPVALCGVENLIVVIRNGRALVLKKGKSQLVREASERLS